jgi:cobalt-zinc-cadmium efflux system membrane fusion protein
MTRKLRGMKGEPRAIRPGSLSATAVALVIGALASCARSGEASHDEQGHDDEHAEEEQASKSDPHHIAEDRVWCEDDVALSEEALARYGIEVEPVRELTLVPKVSAPGHLAFPQGSVARVGSAVEGRIVELRVRSGDRVEPGDTLLVVESPELGKAQSEYLQKRTIAATAGPALDLARDALERAKELHDRVQGIALSDVQRREAELRMAERDREVARADEEAAYSRLLLLGMDEKGIQALEETRKVEPRLAIRAPIEGKIVEVSTTLGELVGPDKDRLLVVGDLRTLWAIAEVSETRLSEVAIGAQASVKVPALGDEDWEGKVAAVPTVLEASTRTAEVRIEVPNPDERMLPGMFIQVEIASSRGAAAPVLAVPDGAVLTIEGRPSVFVPIGPGIFCKHEIEVGPPVGTHIPVLSGLKPGELVVVAGTFRLKAEHGKASAQHEH